MNYAWFILENYKRGKHFMIGCEARYVTICNTEFLSRTRIIFVVSRVILKLQGPKWINLMPINLISYATIYIAAINVCAFSVMVFLLVR